MRPSRPNVLLLMADQLAASALPVYAARAARAPAIARLGAEGVVFEAAYAASPLCAPSRASLMTGRLPSRTGAYDNAADFPPSMPTVAHHLRVRGYRTCLAGKMHFVGPDQLHGFEERVTPDIYPAGFGWTPDWEAGDGRLPWYHDMSAVLEAGVMAATLQRDYDDEVLFRARRWIVDAARRGRADPFFLVASFSHPHDPYQVSRDLWERHRDEDVPPPRLADADPAALDPHSRRLRAMVDSDARPPRDAEVHRARRAYFGAVSYVDDAIGELLGTLGRVGLLDDTVVLLTADHGDFLGERGLWYKMSMREAAARVPLVVWAPGRFAARRVARPVSLLDVPPTLIELAGGSSAEAGEEADGTSLLALLGGGEGGPERVLAEYLAEGVTAPMVMVRRGSAKLIRCPGDPDQVFDLGRDPLETVNVAADPAGAELAGRLGDEADALWDLAALDGAVRASQRRRTLVGEALRRGAPAPWDYRPPDDSARRYIWTGRDLYEAEREARLADRDTT
jgi:choline-sulfatase